MQAVATTVPKPHEPRRMHAPRGQFGNGAARLMATTIARPAVRQGALALLDQAVVSGTSFATSVIIGRLCSKEALGVFYLALTFVYLARGVQGNAGSAPGTSFTATVAGASRWLCTRAACCCIT